MPRVTQKGQVTIPKRIRDALDLKQNDQVVFVRRGASIIIKPVDDVLTLRGKVTSKQKKDAQKTRDYVKKETAKRIAHE